MAMFNNVSLPKMVKDNVVNFLYYKKNELWYSIKVNDKVLEFPVPISDTGDGTFLATDKASLFMRYIKQHLDNIELGKLN